MYDRKLSADIELLVLLLVKHQHMLFATQVLNNYMVRNWNISEAHAAYYTNRYFHKYYPLEVKLFQAKAKKYGSSQVNP